MDSRTGILLLLLSLISLIHANARNMELLDVSDAKTTVIQSITSGRVTKNEQLCTMCETFTAQATFYLAENKTQNEIIGTLHRTCSRLGPYEQQCDILLDYYATLFFAEISKIQPEEFCEKVDLCEKFVSLSLPKNEETCALCQRVVVELRTKLKDPDTQLEIIEVLLKECSRMENYTQECKKLVFRYGPLILVNGEKFLETTDICSLVHACKAGQLEAETSLDSM